MVCTAKELKEANTTLELSAEAKKRKAFCFYAEENQNEEDYKLINDLPKILSKPFTKPHIANLAVVTPAGQARVTVKKADGKPVSIRMVLEVMQTLFNTKLNNTNKKSLGKDKSDKGKKVEMLGEAVLFDGRASADQGQAKIEITFSDVEE